MSTQLPESIFYGTLRGQIITAEADTPVDVDENPDKVVAVGDVIFTATVNRLLDMESDSVIIPKPITVTLDAEGKFEVTLIANDNTNLVPYEWGYIVSFNLVGVDIPSYTIKVSPGVVTDLTELTPVPVPIENVDMMRGERGPAGAGVLFIGDGSEPPADFIGLVVRPLT